MAKKDVPVPVNRRDDILSKAMVRFAANGFDGVSMRDIARDVELNIATLYHYFPDKQAIYQEVVRMALADISGRLAEAATGAEPPPFRLRRFISTLIHIYSGGTPEAGLVDRQQLEMRTNGGEAGYPAVDTLWPTHNAVQALVTELYDHGLDAEAADREKRFLISLVYGATKLQYTHKNMGRQDPYATASLEDQLVDHCLANIEAKRRTASATTAAQSQ